MTKQIEYLETNHFALNKLVSAVADRAFLTATGMPPKTGYDALLLISGMDRYAILKSYAEQEGDTEEQKIETISNPDRGPQNESESDAPNLEELLDGAVITRAIVHKSRVNDFTATMQKIGYEPVKVGEFD